MGFDSQGSEVISPSQNTPGSQPPSLSTSMDPVLTEKDLPAKLEDLTTSVTLTFRHVWSVTGAAECGAWGGPEPGKNEVGCDLDGGHFSDFITSPLKGC